MTNIKKIISEKKIAIVHDVVADYGGGEKVLKVLSTIFPQADIYTSLINYKRFKSSMLPSKMSSSWAQNLPAAKKWPRLIQLLSPFIWPTLNLREYDIVISHGGFYLAHLVNLGSKNPSTLYIHYSITPPKNFYIKEYQQWFEKPLDFLLYPILRYLDKKSAQKANFLWAVSKSVKRRIKRHYHRESKVLYPPVFVPSTPPPSSTAQRRYYCYAGRLEKEKRVELIIKVFNENKLPLYIMGAGRQREELKKMAKPNIKFLGFKSTKELYTIFLKAKAFIHPAIDDDFPLAPIEAMACGTPVIVHKSAGTKEAVLEGKTGMVFKKYTQKALADTIRKFEAMKFDPMVCYSQAKKYSEKRFEKRILKLVSKAYEKFESN